MRDIEPDPAYHANCIEKGLTPEQMPRHVAFIMDGNGRWAKAQLKERTFGHQHGSETIRRILNFSGAYGIQNITVYAFSTENWKRPKKEVNFLMDYIEKTIDKEYDNFIKNKVQVCFLGELEGLPKTLQEKIKFTQEATKNNTKLRLNILLNYGSRSEIVNAFKKLANEKKDLTNITETDISNHLYTAGIPDPELIIRTAGEYRLSNFLLFQAAYSELFFSDVLWPDFDETHLFEILKDYQKRDRRFGGLN